MWVLVAVFITMSGISSQQIGFYETEAECVKAATKIEMSGQAYDIHGECLPSQMGMDM